MGLESLQKLVVGCLWCLSLGPGCCGLSLPQGSPSALPRGCAGSERLLPSSGCRGWALPTGAVGITAAFHADVGCGAVSTCSA